jgi:hypothetical protein
MNIIPQPFKLLINFDNKIPSTAVVILTEEYDRLKDKERKLDELNSMISKLKAILHPVDSKEVEDNE